MWNAPWPTIQVRYRNITKVHFRAVRDDWLERFKKRQFFGGWLPDPERNALLAKKPDLEWSADLPPTTDFRERIEELPVPKDLKPGYYWFIASAKPDFQANVQHLDNFSR